MSIGMLLLNISKSTRNSCMRTRKKRRRRWWRWKL